MKQWIEKLRPSFMADNFENNIVSNTGVNPTTNMEFSNMGSAFEAQDNSVFQSTDSFPNSEFQLIDMPRIQIHPKLGQEASAIGLSPIVSKISGKFYWEERLEVPKNEFGYQLIPFIQVNLGDLKGGLFKNHQGLIQVFIDPFTYAQEEWNILSNGLPDNDPRIQVIYHSNPRATAYKELVVSQHAALELFREEFSLSLTPSNFSDSDLLSEFKSEEHLDDLLESEDHFLFEIKSSELKKFGYPVRLKGAFQFYLSNESFKAGRLNELKFSWVNEFASNFA